MKNFYKYKLQLPLYSLVWKGNNKDFLLPVALRQPLDIEQPQARLFSEVCNFKGEYSAATPLRNFRQIYQAYLSSVQLSCPKTCIFHFLLLLGSSNMLYSILELSNKIIFFSLLLCWVGYIMVYTKILAMYQVYHIEFTPSTSVLYPSLPPFLE
jgi:hypothetical protein